MKLMKIETFEGEMAYINLDAITKIWEVRQYAPVENSGDQYQTVTVINLGPLSEVMVKDSLNTTAYRLALAAKSITLQNHIVL